MVTAVHFQKHRQRLAGGVEGSDGRRGIDNDPQLNSERLDTWFYTNLAYDF